MECSSGKILEIRQLKNRIQGSKGPSYNIKYSGSENMKAKVLILMGSDSDLPVMESTAKVLKEFNIPYKMTVSSAHRTPDAINNSTMPSHLYRPANTLMMLPPKRLTDRCYTTFL
jgi:hypothetical protein